jgi:Protein of unknown function (DUF2515)
MRAYGLQPGCFKWTAMAAVILFPLRLDSDGNGYVDLRRSLGRRRLLLQDVDRIRMTNNAIYNDIFWAHLAYAAADNDDGIERLRILLRPHPRCQPLLAGFEAIHRGRRLLEDAASTPDSRRAADDLVWSGNVALLEHEQRAQVQPSFDQLSCVFARLVSLGCATRFEVRGMRREIAYFTSFSLYALTHLVPQGLRTRTWPRITRYDDRWGWLLTSVVPRFRRFDGDPDLIGASLRRIVHDATAYAAMPCVAPLSPG